MHNDADEVQIKKSYFFIMLHTDSRRKGIWLGSSVNGSKYNKREETEQNREKGLQKQGTPPLDKSCPWMQACHNATDRRT